MSPVTLARNAMATRFEMVLHGDNPIALRAAGEEALNEIERIEAQLSLYRPTSEIAHLNARAAQQAVRVDPSLFRLLQHAQRLSAETNGAFDITVAPLMRCWGFLGGSGAMPEPKVILEARAKIGMHLLELNESDFTVRFTRPGVMLDLGSIGKGYALERAAEILREAGMTSALLHGGTSTVCAIGTLPDAAPWQVAIENPVKHLFAARPERGLSPIRSQSIFTAHSRVENAAAEARPLAVVPLKDEALSVSAVWGKSFSNGEMILGHVIDPRTGYPVQETLAAAVVVSSATESDALSTALLTLGAAGHDQVASLRPGMKTLLVTGTNAPGGFQVHTRGIDVMSGQQS